MFYDLPTHSQKLSEIQDWWMDFLILHTCVHMWLWQQNLAHILRFIQEVNSILEKKIVNCNLFCVTKHMFITIIFYSLINFIKYFSSSNDIIWNMLVLLTTANFPDIMLPAIKITRWARFFFVIYLILGLFLLMNLLLSTVYSKYQ